MAVKILVNMDCYCHMRLTRLLIELTKRLACIGQSLQQVIVKYNLHSGTKRLDHQFIEQQNEVNSIKLNHLLWVATQEIRPLTKTSFHQQVQVRVIGKKLEELLERGLSRVSKEKDERIAKQISELKRRELLIMEENRLLKQLRTVAHEQGQSSESTIICGSSYPLQDCDSSDTSLNLGLSLFK
ncbi:hypothetical protein L6164_032641 [Bauhinia variegata]|uniref:Uncharacterized protein n=1 Tax=Bauhinia variegata TaxID=167791 RepID=A0ACB9KPB9_BAUVA|nr:hypothetical protein L6164_032641 [Bauhinia variegata]